MTSGRPVRTRIVVISMADASERRSRFEARARGAPVAWNFYPARTALVKENFIDRARSIVELAGNAYGTQGYAITKAGAKLFLDHCRIVCRPIDDEMDRTWVHGQRNLAVFPSPILEESSGSTIGSSRFETFAVPKRLKLKRLIAQRVERWQRDASTTLRRVRRFRARWAARTRSQGNTDSSRKP